jgi:glyoxylase-like metal-dependent hydrolase (beta-lactamase superfamily II)
MHDEVMRTFTGQLHPLTPAPLPFAASLHVRSFVVPREHDNLLVYGSPTVMDDAAEIESLGGVSHQYLNHWHEAMFADERIRDELGARVVVHEADRAATEERQTVDATFADRASLGGGFELIPIPGHTPGATAFLWDNGERRYLFTGDTIYLTHGEWVAAVLDSSDRDAYIGSLELLREIEFDVLVPWGSSAGEPWFAATDRDDSRRRIGAIIERVRSGADR